MGLADDGGLLLPETLPVVDDATLASWGTLTYPELARAVMSLYIDDIPDPDLRRLIDRSYAAFGHEQVTPVKECGGLHIMELFHGPTLAFKDVALQFLGNLFEYILAESGGHMNILGATSGDTGSAAIYGVRGKARINIFILHPYQRVSPVQEMQMTTVLDDNVFNIAVRGTFDDGQAIVKAIFNDIPFKERYRLGAINSINWARLLAQVVYYVHGWLRVGAPAGQAVDFAVPTGNFGDIFAGYVARRLLSPQRIRRLILATNENNLLSRFVLAGDYSKGEVKATSSPSMDIQVASNFERYLYYLNQEDAARTRRDMEDFDRTGRLDFSDRSGRIREDFDSRSVIETETIETITDFYKENHCLLDPHTAVGVRAALDLRRDETPMICLATAHPAKFGEAVRRAIGQEPQMPPPLAGLGELPSRCEVLDADAGQVRHFIEAHALQG